MAWARTRDGSPTGRKIGETRSRREQASRALSQERRGNARRAVVAGGPLRGARIGYGARAPVRQAASSRQFPSSRASRRCGWNPSSTFRSLPASDAAQKGRGERAQRQAPPLQAFPPGLLGRGAGDVGGARRGRRVRLGRHAPAADPIPGDPQAPAHIQINSLDAPRIRDPRRDGRGRAAAQGHAGAPAQRLHRHRGPPLPRRITASIRSACCARWSRTCCTAAFRRAARPSPSSSPRTCSSTQDRTLMRKLAGGDAGAVAGAQIHQERRSSSSISTASISAPAPTASRRRRSAISASRRRNVTLAEAALLAGLVKSPSRLAPTRNFDGAEQRAQIVLAAMADAGSSRTTPPRRRWRRPPRDRQAERRRLRELRSRLGHGRAQRAGRAGRRGHRRRHHHRRGAAGRRRKGARSRSSPRRARSSASSRARWWR